MTPAEILEDLGDGPAATAAEDWKRSKNDRQYIPAPHRNGIVYRVGDETIAQALERDAAQNPQDQAPRRKGKERKARGIKPPAPKPADLRELEPMLAEVLRSPAMPCALLGDAWAANHFTEQGPLLARHVIVSAEHNPWLRKKLEAATDGEEFALQLMSISTLVVATVGYIAPPLIWWLNLAVSPKTREMFSIPPRRPPKPRPGPRVRQHPPSVNGDANTPPVSVAAAA